MDGFATQVGGAVVDSGNFDWLAHAEKFPGLCTPDESYHGLTYVKAFGKMGYTTKLVAQLMRDLGSIPAPQNSFLLNMGLQTLHLRMAQHCKNAQRIAEFLHDEPKVARVHYCGLPDDKAYALGQKYLPNGSCGVIAFGLKGDRETAIKWMDSLEMINIVTHVADARTCVLHPAIHTHRQLSDEQLRAIAGRGGLIGLNCAKAFIRLHDDGSATASELAVHAAHIKQVVGAEHLCLGFDFCSEFQGTPGVMGQDSIDYYDHAWELTAELLAHGFSEEETEGVLGNNLLNFLEKTIG